jgi:hypothetical protein
VFFRIRERFWYNSEKSFNNNSALPKERRPEVRKRDRLKSSPQVAANRTGNKSTPLEKSLSLALAVFFAKNMRKAN